MTVPRIPPKTNAVIATTVALFRSIIRTLGAHSA